MSEYEIVPIPEHGQRGKWKPLITALVKAKGRALVVSQVDFEPNTIAQQCNKVGYNLHRQRQQDKTWVLWLTSKKEDTK